MKVKKIIFLFIVAAAITIHGCKTNTASAVENNTVENITVADDGKSFPVRFRGEWRKDNFANTITFTENTLKASNQSYTWYFHSVSGDVYTIKPDNSKYTGKLTIKFINGNLEISGDSSPNYETNWNGVWKKVK
jgi:predicted transcriptional regulator